MPKNAQNYRTIALISYASKVMLKILQARLQQYMNHELPREFQKNIYFCFIDYTEVFDCVDNKKLWEILEKIGIPDHPTYLLKNLYAGQEATIRTRHGTMDLFQIGKGVHQGCVLSPCSFNLYAENIMWNAGLDEA